MTNNELYDTKYVWHCKNRHTKSCSMKYFKCRGTECNDWCGSKDCYAKTSTKEKKCS